MGFDPRQWPSSTSASDDRDRPKRSERVTSNVEDLLRENDSLRREVQRLHLELERLRRQQWHRPQPDFGFDESHQETSAHVSSAQVRRWGELLALQPGWNALRQNGLEDLIDQLNRSSFHSKLNLRQRLDRLVSGFGSDLMSAVGSRPTKKTAAILAAFALYGVRASEWLDEEPRRVVAELRHRQPSSSQGRRTRSDRRATDRQPTGHAQNESSDPRVMALALLGLQSGASQNAIKQAFRKLVKQHHPDLGGSAAAFRALNDAYQLLMSQHG